MDCLHSGQRPPVGTCTSLHCLVLINLMGVLAGCVGNPDAAHHGWGPFPNSELEAVIGSRLLLQTDCGAWLPQHTVVVVLVLSKVCKCTSAHSGA